MTWLLRNGTQAGSLDHLIESVSRLQVVSGCGCGCASIDFDEEEGNAEVQLLAEAIGKSTSGVDLLVILWGRDDAVTGLEVVDLGPQNAKALPDPSQLNPWSTHAPGFILG